VKVLEVDVARKRIVLTRRLDETPAPRESRPSRDPSPAKRGKVPEGRTGASPRNRPTGAPPRGNAPAKPPANNALAEAFARAKRS